MAAQGPNLECRWYKEEYPEIESLVMVSVQSVEEVGAYVQLLEYGNKEGMILLSELSRRRIRSISKLIRVGRNEVVVVLRVDKEKGYVDLSKRRVRDEDKAFMEAKYIKGKEVHSIMRHVAKTTNTDVEVLYRTFGWPLADKFGHIYDAFCASVQDFEAVFGEYLEEISSEVREVLEATIRRRLTPKPIKMRADIDVSCYSYEGIDAIKAALRTGQIERDGMTVEVKLVAPPSYVLLLTTTDKKAGTALLQESIDNIRNEIEERGGSLAVKVAPRATSERDEKDFATLLEELEKANQEVDGDADSDEGEDDA